MTRAEGSEKPESQRTDPPPRVAKRPPRLSVEELDRLAKEQQRNNEVRRAQLPNGN